ncbi:spondin-2 [Plakobranchus ocellatus]|uniref:Spondin-2 n=1 Tax=Plakobranchus ocellatus TaxID=259542 RepID=A0AAV4DWD9_9GAST|nr:spondin-2 [Plakobranchus ocellatus]
MPDLFKIVWISIYHITTEAFSSASRTTPRLDQSDCQLAGTMKLFNALSVICIALLLLVRMRETAGKRRFKHSYINCRPGYIVQYKMTVHTLWSKEVFPRMYPLYRPPAQWSSLIGRTHGPGYIMWEEGENATEPVKQFAEEGDSSYLDIESRQGYADVLDTFTAPPVHQGVGSTSVMVTLDGTHTRLSFMMKIVPSPDWFIGLSSENLCAEGKWRKQIYADLQPMDAGTDQGLTFTAPNWPHEPFQPIFEITNRNPNHQASSFYYPEYESLPRLAYVELELLSQYRLRRTFSVIGKESENVYETGTRSSNEGESSSGELSESSVEIPDYVADSASAEITTAGLNSEEKTKVASELGDITTGQYRNHYGRGQSLSSAGYEQTSQGRAYSASHRDSTGDWGTRESTTSIAGVMIPALRASRISSSMRNPHGKRKSGRDGEPRGIMSSRSLTEPQFAEVAEELPSTNEVTHCEVTEWTEWTPCSQTCGFGKRQRSRTVVSSPSNGGANCPLLRQESLCGSMRTCQWNHFSFLNKNGRKRRHGHRGFKRY